MLFEWDPMLDWNPVVHVLDKLSEGTHSLIELSYMIPRYDRAAFLQGLLFLADRELVELSAGRGPYQPIAATEWPRLLREAFGSDAGDRGAMIDTIIELTTRGEQVLSLFRIGHP
jgi:hypothetical protein